MSRSSFVRGAISVAALSVFVFISTAEAHDYGRDGLRRRARRQLKRAGVNKYLGQFSPMSSETFAQDWTKHTFDTEGGDGPICIGGTPYSVFSKAGDPDKVLIFLQGGGACWEGFPQCNPTAEAQFPPPAAFLPGMFAPTSPDGSIENEIGTYSVVYLPYCDGSVFGGDNDVENDPTFGVRRHRGLRNVSAGMDIAKDLFPHADTVLIAGSSAGGVGSTAFAPFLARFLYGNDIDLFVFNDAGPVALNPEQAIDAARARARDWQFTKFYPRSCVRQGLCDPEGQQTGLIKWRMLNDSTIREAFYETDGDLTNLGFVTSNLPGTPPFFPLTQAEYRLILDEAHGELHYAFPDRYKRYIVSGANPACFGFVVYSHTALQGGNTAAFGCPEVDLFYDLEAGGVPLHRWANDFVRSTERRWRRGWWHDGYGKYGKGGKGKRWRRRRRARNQWIDIVEPFAPGPPLPTAP